MVPSALVNVLANAVLSGEAEKDAIVSRLGHILGRDWRWIRPLAGRYLETFIGRTRPRRREVVSFLRRDQDFAEACQRYGHQIKIVHRIAGAQWMRPVAAAEAWPIPRIETTGALADWLELDPSELRWFADLKALGYKRRQAVRKRLKTGPALAAEGTAFALYSTFFRSLFSPGENAPSSPINPYVFRDLDDSRASRASSLTAQ